MANRARVMAAFLDLAAMFHKETSEVPELSSGEVWYLRSVYEDRDVLRYRVESWRDGKQVGYPLGIEWHTGSQFLWGAEMARHAAALAYGVALNELAVSIEKQYTPGEQAIAKAIGLKLEG